MPSDAVNQERLSVLLCGMRYAEAKKRRDTAIHTYTCPCNENTTLATPPGYCLSVASKHYDMSAGSYVSAQNRAAAASPVEVSKTTTEKK